MTAHPDPNWLPTSQLRSMHCTLLAHSEKIGHQAGRLESIERLLHHLVASHVASHLPRPGPPSSSDPSPYPTPGTPSSSPSSNPIGPTVKALGERVARLIKIAGLIKGAWGFWTIIAPSLLWAATAAWKLISPWLRWLWQLAVGS